MAANIEVFCRVSPDDGTPSPGWCCSFSPCGAYLAIGQANGKIAIWDCLTRGVARNIDISFSSQSTTTPGSPQSQSQTKTPVQNKQIQTSISGRKRPRQAPEYLEAPVTTVAWSCDSKTLLCGTASMAWVLATIDTDSGTVLRFFDFGRLATDPYPATVLYHPICKTDAVIALSDGSVVRLNTLTGEENYYKVTSERKLRVKEPASLPPFLNENGKNQATSSTSSTSSSSSSSSSSSTTPVTHLKDRALAISPNGKLIFVGGNKAIEVYDSETRQLLLLHSTLESSGTLKKGTGNIITSLTVDVTGTLLVANLSSKCLRVFGIIVEENNINHVMVKNVTLIWTGIDLYDAINRSRRIGTPLIVNNSNTGSCIVAGEIDHHKIFIWEASSGKLLRAVSNHWPTVQKHLGVVSLASHPTRIFFASCAMDGTICLWCQPNKQNWSVKMLEYINLDNNIISTGWQSEDEQDEKNEKDEKKKSNNNEGNDDRNDINESNESNESGKPDDAKDTNAVGYSSKKKRTVMSQEDVEKAVVVDIGQPKQSFFYLRSDPPAVVQFVQNEEIKK